MLNGRETGAPKKGGGGGGGQDYNTCISSWENATASTGSTLRMREQRNNKHCIKVKLLFSKVQIDRTKGTKSQWHSVLTLQGINQLGLAYSNNINSPALTNNS